MNTVSLRFLPNGTCRCLYNEVIDLSSLGRLTVKRATVLEFDNPTQSWQVCDLNGFCLYSSLSRGDCLRWEQEYLEPEDVNESALATVK